MCQATSDICKNNKNNVSAASLNMALEKENKNTLAQKKIKDVVKIEPFGQELANDKRWFLICFSQLPDNLP